MVWLVLLLTMMVSAPAQAAACAPERFGEQGYVVCTVDPQRDELKLFWKSEDGAPYRHFGLLADAVAAEGQELVFAMNAGMYSPDFTPSGLYVENGEERIPLNTRTIDAEPARVPNFFKQPNGVFYFGPEGAGVMTTEAYDQERPAATYATQSGPMLVIDGALNPILIPGSTDRTRRSGVGVCEDGLVRLAISDSDVNFHDFATLFRDGLGCPNVLFLDGGRGTGLYDPALRRRDFSWHGGYGPMLGMVR